MKFEMSSNIRTSRHRTLEGAFRAAAKAKLDGANVVYVEDRQPIDHRLYYPLKYNWELTRDGEYVAMRGSLTPTGKHAVKTICTSVGLPFADSWHAVLVAPILEVA